MIGRYIAAVGLELEGPFRSAVEKSKRVSDFKEEVFNHPTNHPDVKHLKECVSTVLRYDSHVEEFFKEVEPHYIPEAVVQGMGFHIHFSFNDQKYYDIIFSKKFVTKYAEDLFKAFKADESLQARPRYRSPSGTNFYRMDYPDEYFKHSISKKTHATDRQERYYFINFWRAFRDHQTFEVRIFPSNTLKRMKEYLDFTTEYINNYIKENLNDDELHFNFDCEVQKNVIEPLVMDCGKEVLGDITVR